MRKANMSFFSLTKWQRVLIVQGFPSPQQFQVKRFMVMCEAIPQTPPYLPVRELCFLWTSCLSL